MGVFGIKVCTVLSKVLLPCLSHQGESWLNAARQLAVSALYRGIISCHLELGGPVTLPRVWPHWKVRHPPDLERDITTWAWAWAQVQAGKEPQGQAAAQRRKLHVMGYTEEMSTPVP